MIKKQKIFFAVLTTALAITGIFGYSNLPAKADDSASSIQDDISKYNQKLKDAQQELAAEQSQLYKNQTKISATKKLIAQITSDVSKKEAELNDLNNQADANKNMLSEYIRQIYFIDREDPMVSLPILDGNLNDLSANFDGMIGVKAKIIASLETINTAKDQTEQAKADLANLQKTNAAALANQQVQQADIANTVQDTQSTIQDLQKKLSSLQSDLNALLGQSYSTDDIWKAVKFASDKTNVPRGFLMGILQVESHLGANIGTGNYKTDMNPNQQSTFKSICKSLGINPDKQPVSRRVCYNKKAADHCGGWGGAMGAEQFIPTTWMAYSSQVSSITGNSPANPWNLYDGITAMAVKLARTPGVTAGKTSALKQATCSYLGTCSASYMSGVLYWADNYKQLLN
jgi:predicted  nucleic acid-binding Zn-ribbon protein